MSQQNLSSDPTTHSPPQQHSFQMALQPRSKPPRYLVIENDNVILRDQTRSSARRIIAALILADLHKPEHSTIVKRLNNEGI